MVLSVIIPTRDRRDILLETLRRLAEQAASARFDVVVVDDGSLDGTPAAVRAFAASSQLTLTLLEQTSSGPATARNRGVAASRAPACLFLGDDTWPCADLVSRHCAFHVADPTREAALLGRVHWARESRSPFMDWLDRDGIQFAYRDIRDARRVPGHFFYTSNVSVKRQLFQDVGGFDESFRYAAGEDIELGLRLERAGMRLEFDPDAAAEHFHPTDLADAIRRARIAGEAGALLNERFPRWPAPPPPGWRHRAKAAGLAVANALPVQTDVVRHASWRFLCHQAYREAYWGIDVQEPRALRTGGFLARLAQRDPATRPTG